MWLRVSAFFLLILLVACGRSAQDYLKRGNTLFTDGHYADAEINYRKAIQKAPNLSEAYYRLGLAEVKQNQGFAAHEALKRAVELAPEEIDPKVALADVCFAFYFSDSRKPKAMYDEASQLTSAILHKQPNSPDGLRLRGALSILDLKPKEAVESYRKANELRPSDGEIVLGYSRALLQAGRSA